MRTFISWSGKRSREVARKLSTWITDVLQHAETWMSSEDIEPGSRWSEEIRKQLGELAFGILCVTPENYEKPWLLFEAGALAKTLDETFLCPYLIDFENSKLPEPLAQFQSVKATREGTLALIHTINSRLPKPLPVDKVERQFDRCWQELRHVLEEVERTPAEPRHEFPHGVESVHLNRSKALEEFRRHLEDEIQRAEAHQPSRLWIVGSSLLGFLEAWRKEGTTFLERAVRAECSIRILMTKPEVAGLRESAERRAQNEISSEIASAISRLQQIGVVRDRVRFYPGTPTAFALATSRKMLLNPYPYTEAAYHCFSLIVSDTSTGVQRTGAAPHDDVFGQYLAAHFKGAWELSEEVPEEFWKAAKSPAVLRVVTA